MSRNRGKKVLVASICAEQVYSQYANCVGKAMLYFASCKNPCPMTYEIIHATYLHDGRNDVVTLARKIGATHIIWIDADMMFPPDSFERLLNHNLDYVGVNYSNRKPPHFHTAMYRILRNQNEEGKPLKDILGYTPVYTTDSSTGLQKVDAIGFGLCVTSMKLFDTIERPWFEYYYVPEKEQHAGEDIYFSKKLEPYFDCFIDHDLSKEIQHISVGYIDYNAPNRKMVKEVTGADQILKASKSPVEILRESMSDDTNGEE